jgi:UV DNA damage repair endonuclease
MAKKWNELSSRSRRPIVAGGVFEGVLRVAALIDLAPDLPHSMRSRLSGRLSW